MNARIIIALIFAVLSVFNQAHAVIIGGEEVGWTIDFDKVTPEQKKEFEWSDETLKTTGFRKFSNTYSAPNQDKWTLSGKVVAIHGKGGPAFFSVTEIMDGSTVEDVKKIHYNVMSEKQGFKEDKCTAIESQIQSCGVLLYNWSPAKIFYASFYEWKTSGRTFILVVRNAQPYPDMNTPEKAIKVLISLIK